MKKLLSALLMMGLCFSLTACSAESPSGANVMSREESVSEEASRQEESEPESKMEAEVLPVEVPASGEGVIREIQVLGANGVTIKDDRVESSGGSLVAKADSEILTMISGVLRQEWQKVERPQAEEYDEFIMVRAAGTGNWRVQLMQKDENSGSYLSITDAYGKGPDFYEIDSETFDSLWDAVGERISMIEAPVDEFFTPVQIVVAEYRAGTYSSDEYAAVFEKAPQGAVIPAVNSVEDFTVAPGSGAVAYKVIFPIEGVRYNMVLSMIQVYPSGGKNQNPTWRVMKVNFEPRE